VIQLKNLSFGEVAMDDDDFRYLIGIVETELRDVGLGEIADTYHYVITEPETGDARLLEPKRRLIEMLDAFDNAMAIRDLQTYKKAMMDLNVVTDGKGPNDVVYAPVPEERDEQKISLSLAPDLSNLRSNLQFFIQRFIMLDPGPEPAPDAGPRMGS